MNNPEQKARLAIVLEKVSSAEHIMRPDRTERALANITFSVRLGQTCGVWANDPYRSQLLLEIVANVKPYYSGRCRLVQWGMMQKKRTILPHLFFIDSPGMLYDNMTVLEFLMFATAQSEIPTVMRQKQILESLVKIGLDYISLSAISYLTPAERTLITLLAASFSSCDVIVFSAAKVHFEPDLIKPLSAICGHIRNRNKALLLGTLQPELIDAACTHAVAIKGSTVAFAGSLAELYSQHDKVLYLFSHDNPEAFQEELARIYPHYRYACREGKVLVYSQEGCLITDKDFISRLLANSASFHSMEINSGKAAYAFEDLPEIL